MKKETKRGDIRSKNNRRCLQEKYKQRKWRVEAKSVSQEHVLERVLLARFKETEK